MDTYIRLMLIKRDFILVAHLNLGLVLSLVGLKEEAVQTYRRCSKLDTSGLKDPRTHESARISALFNLGRLYFDEGRFHKAIHIFLDAVKRMPTYYQPQVIHNTTFFPTM